MVERSAGRNEKERPFRTSHRALVAEESVLGSGSGGARDGAAGIDHSIRIPRLAHGVQCPKCQQSFWASGPTGYENELPICDACLLEVCHPLGMLLALALITRQLAHLESGQAADYDHALKEAGIFAQVYEQVASQDGPPRRFELPEKYRLWDDDGGRD